MEDVIVDATKNVVPLVSSAAKPLIKKGIDKMLKRADGIDDNISDAFKVQGREMTIICPESIQKYSLSLTAKQTGFFSKKAKFELGKVRRANIRSIVGLQSIDAITPLEKGFELNLKQLKPGEQYVLDVEYFLEDQNFLDSLVNREVVDESPEGDSTKYWMVAQLKHLESLKSEYCKIDLRDVDFNVNVGVHQDVSTKIPNLFKEQLETIAELIKKKGRDEKFNLFLKLLHIQTTKFGGKEYKLLGEVMNLFSTSRFSKYVNVEKDFHYSTCEKGTSVYDFPIPTWPKFMKVTSRTDLSLNKPASNGQLIYERVNFMAEIEKIFGL